MSPIDIPLGRIDLLNADELQGWTAHLAVPLNVLTDSLSNWLAQAYAHIQTRTKVPFPPVDRDQARKFLVHLSEKIGFTSLDLVLMRIFLGRFLANASPDTAARTPPGLSILLAAYTAQSLQYDEPLSKRVWTYYARMAMPDFVDALFSFLDAFAYDTSVSALTFNDVYCDLSGQPLKTLLPRAVPTPMAPGDFVSAPSSYRPPSLAPTANSSDYFSAYSNNPTMGSRSVSSAMQIDGVSSTVQPMQEAYPAPAPAAAMSASKLTAHAIGSSANNSTSSNKIVKGLNSIMRFARRRNSRTNPAQ